MSGDNKRKMSHILQKIADFAGDRAGNIKVVAVVVGLGYTAVQLENSRLGLAYTFKETLPPGCPVLKNAGQLAGSYAKDIVKLLLSFNPVESSIGLAAVNALTNGPERTGEKMSELEAMNIHTGDKVAMAGYFGPLIPKIKSTGAELFIIERQPRAAETIYPEWSYASIIPAADVVIISSTTLLNRTFEPLVACCETAREVCLLGPSTPLIPEIFSSCRVTLLSGIVVKDPERVLQIVSEAGGTRSFLPYANKINLKLKA